MSVVCHHCKRAFSLKLLGQFHLNFICSFLAKKEKESVCIVRPGHMTKMAAIPIYGKNLKKRPSSSEPLDQLP